MRILCIGDSNTYGYDPRSYAGSRYPEDIRWTDRLGMAEVINHGVNGMTVPWEYSMYERMVANAEADLVIVMLGTNDLLMGRSAEKIAARMAAFLDSIVGLAKQVLLIAPPLLEFGEWVYSDEVIDESSELGALYREKAEERGCLFADAGEWGIDMTFDGVHFSPEGHAEFARRLERLLK